MSIRVADPTCCTCGRPLTDAASRAFMIGPECRKDMTAQQLRTAMLHAAQADDPFHIPAPRPASVQARVNNHNARALTQPDAVQLCRHENRAGACPDCRRENDPWRAAERILAEIRGQSFAERRAERVRVLTARYAHVTPCAAPPRPPRTKRPAPRRRPPGPAGPVQLELA